MPIVKLRIAVAAEKPAEADLSAEPSNLAETEESPAEAESDVE